MEVGKTYKIKIGSGLVFYKAIQITPNKNMVCAVFDRLDLENVDYECVIRSDSYDRYIEVKTPRKAQTKFIPVCENVISSLPPFFNWMSIADSEQSARISGERHHKVLDVIELNWTEKL